MLGRMPLNAWFSKIYKVLFYTSALLVIRTLLANSLNFSTKDGIDPIAVTVWPDSQQADLPTVNVLRLATFLRFDLGFRAAIEVFHNLPRWNNRFQIKMHTILAERAAGQSSAANLRKALRALELPNQSFVAMLGAKLIQILAQLGPDFMADVQTVAQITPIYNMNSMCLGASAVLDDLKTFPLLFRLLPASSEQLRNLIGLLKLLEIHQVSTIAFKEPAYVQNVKMFTEHFTSRMSGTVESAIILSDDVQTHDEIGRFFAASKDKINYIVNSFGLNMRYSICDVYKTTTSWVLQPTFFGLEFYDPRDAWRLPLLRSSDEGQPYCTPDELRAALNGSVFASSFNPNYINDTESLTRPRHDGVTLKEIKQRIQAAANSATTMNNISVDSFASYEGAFAMFTALYRTDERMEQQFNVRVHQIDPKKSSALMWQRLAGMLHQELQATSFEGALGHMLFGPNQGRIGGIDLIQYQGLTAVADDGQLIDNFVKVGGSSSDGKLVLNLTLLKFRTSTTIAPHLWREQYEKQLKSDIDTSIRNSAVLIAIIAFVAVCVAVIVVGVAAIAFLRRKRLQQQHNLTWLLPNSSLERQRSQQVSSRYSASTQNSRTLDDCEDGATFFVINHTRVHIRPVTVNVPPEATSVLRETSPATRYAAVELNRIFDSAVAMYSLRYENINKFFGICLSYQPVQAFGMSASAVGVLVFEYQRKQSLRNMLISGNDDVNYTDWSVDSELQFCFVADCLRGMRALHEVGLVHGFLHTENILLDSRLTCKVTDYGLAKFARTGEELEPLEAQLHTSDGNVDENKLAFRSPEQLRGGFYDCDTKKSDIYSTGMVMVEIITREIPAFSYPAYQGIDLPSNASAGLCSLILKCIRTNPADRPSTMDVAYRNFKQLPEFTSNLGSIVESLAQRLQSYANDLESLVAERTRALFEEVQRSDQLLLQILPVSVANELRAGREVQPEFFECVSVYFSDVVNFPALTINSTPMQIVDLLNSLYVTADSVLEQFSVYKVETIGDTYMVASGLPQRNGNKHADEMCRFATTMLDTMSKFLARNVNESAAATSAAHLRIGLHCGSCVAAVIGIKLPRYCLFGDTINTASRMQSTGEPDKIHCSSAMRTFTEQHYSDKFTWHSRGKIDVKGLGEVFTQWLLC